MQCLSCSSEKIYCPYIVYDSAGKLEEIQPTGCFHARNGQLLNADSVRSFCKSVGTPLVAINVVCFQDGLRHHGSALVPGTPMEHLGVGGVYHALWTSGGTRSQGTAWQVEGVARFFE